MTIKNQKPRTKNRKRKSAYAQAGVDIDEMMSGLTAIKRMVKSTAQKGLLSDMGSFGGLFQAPGKDHVLVASTDGVGTKLKVASMAKRHDTVGQDIVNHCVNDILVQGARPLFFLDYLGTAKLRGSIFRDVVKGICAACRQNQCTLLGGETAEMPGLYPAGEYDLVGTIVGCVPRKKIVTGEAIRPGDTVIGLPSSGLHTNGYSLARQIIFDKAGLTVNRMLPGTRRRLGDLLLAVHRSYLGAVSALMKQVTIRGMAHITGGGVIDNIPRILPSRTRVIIDTTTWTVPPLFRFMQETGKVDAEEMYRVFNMGIGYVIIVRPRDAARSLRILRRAGERPWVAGTVEKARSKGVVLHSSS